MGAALTQETPLSGSLTTNEQSNPAIDKNNLQKDVLLRESVYMNNPILQGVIKSAEIDCSAKVINPSIVSPEEFDEIAALELEP